MIVAAVGATAVLAGAVHGAFHRNSPIFGRVLTRLPRNGRPRVSLTFDDGPNPDATPVILDALRARGVRATFFVLGRHAERWPELVERAVAEGHQVGNHGYFHRRLHFTLPASARDDLVRGRDAIGAAAGVAPAHFRAPHGFRSPWLSGIARSLGEMTVGWSLGVWDSDLPGTDVIVRRTVAGARDGSILLLHDGDGRNPRGDRMQTATAVGPIVDALAEAGYTFDVLPT